MSSLARAVLRDHTTQPLPGSAATLITLAAILALAAPALVLRYLPTTDIPQHLAIASMLAHAGEPAYGFDSWYEPANESTLRMLAYATQYRVTLWVGSLSSLEFGIRVFVFLSLVAYPVAVLVALRCLHKPAWLALLALPLVYNRAFFWGFASFELSVGLALAACGLLTRPRSLATDTAIAVLATVVVATHLYGVVLLLGFIALRLLFEGRIAFARRALPALPAAIGFGLWAVAALRASGYGTNYGSPLSERLLGFGDAVLGGWQDRSDLLVLAGFGAGFVVLAAPALPLSAARWRALGIWERVFALYAALNLALFLGLPEFSSTALFVNFRHAFLALCFLPLLVPTDALARRPRLAPALLAGLAAASIFVAWVHLVAFDREARSFDRIVDAMPERPKILSMIFDTGDVVRTFPYIHFPAYIQAQKGGVLHQTFPQMFWNLPIRLRDDAALPRAPGRIPWRLRPPDFEKFFGYYDYLITRAPKAQIRRVELHPAFHYRLLREEGPWRLYAAPPAPGG